jgi:hypothetical protein
MFSFFPSLIVVYSLHPDLQSVPEDGKLFAKRSMNPTQTGLQMCSSETVLTHSQNLNLVSILSWHMQIG